MFKLPYVARINLAICGIRRSGNHAIRKWIEGCCTNDEQLIERELNCRWWKKLHGSEIWPSWRLRDRMHDLGQPAELVVRGYEEISPERFSLHRKNGFIKIHQAHLAALDALVYRSRVAPVFHQRYATVFIIRNPYNAIASYIRNWADNKEMVARERKERTPEQAARIAANLWVSYAKEFTGETCYVPDATWVEYDRWFVDLEYRRSVSKRLGVPFSDRNLLQVGGTGGGSSFDGTKYNGNAQKMKVLERWQAMLDREAFTSIFRINEELRRLASALFGPPPWESHR